MKRINLFLILLSLCFSIEQSQSQTITLAFNADYHGNYINLDSIWVQNISKGADTMLYYPDNTLFLEIPTRTDEYQFIKNRFTIHQNKPNPFSDKTLISLNIPDDGFLRIYVSNSLGGNCASLDRYVDKGNYTYLFEGGVDKFYILTADFEGISKTIKMISTGGRALSKPTLNEYSYSAIAFELNSLKSSTGFTFVPGDTLRYNGFAEVTENITGSDVIIDAPLNSNIVTFNLENGVPCPDEPIVKDIEGNTYDAILINHQCWFKQNLKTTTYNNGIPIQEVTDNLQWQNLISGAYAWYENDTSWAGPYGALYNWYVTVDTNGVCPKGWKVPDNDDWIILKEYLNGPYNQYGNFLKSCRQVNSGFVGYCDTDVHPRWDEDSLNNGIDSLGFNGIPGGFRFQNGIFSSVGNIGQWWSTTESTNETAWNRSLHTHSGSITTGGSDKNLGASIRCMKPDTLYQNSPNVPHNPIPSDGNVIYDIKPILYWSCEDPDNDPLNYSIYFGTDSSPDLIEVNYSDTSYPTGFLEYNQTYYWRIVAYDSYGDTTTGPLWSFSLNNIFAQCPGNPVVTDIDGNEYNTVMIGDQCWMAEDLKTTTYRFGSPIQNVPDQDEWINLSEGAYVWYNNDTSWKDIYGALYNWYTVVDSGKICPAGWKVPTDDQLSDLINYIGSLGLKTGESLKSCRQIDSPLGDGCNTEIHPRWDYWADFSYGTNIFGFSAIPGGVRDYFGTFYYIGESSGYWSETNFNEEKAKELSLGYAALEAYMFSSQKVSGYSVRCIKDTTANSAFIPSVETGAVSNITDVSALAEGEIAELGSSGIVQYGHCWSTNPNPTIADYKTEFGNSDTTGIYVSTLNELIPETIYYIRAYAINGEGADYGETVTMTTMTSSLIPAAEFEATPLSGISPLDVYFTDLSTNNPTNWNWDFGDGYFSTEQNPVHIYTISGIYTVKLEVSNSYGADVEIKNNLITVEPEGCPEAPTVEWQGQVYSTVQIGDQCWMRENLNWDTGTSWCYNNDPANCDIYGRLYPWYIVMNGSSSSNTVPSGVQGICPDGWHIPSDAEWCIVSQYIDPTVDCNSTSFSGTNAGIKMKSTEGWFNGGNGNNVSGFTGLPTGYRYNNTLFYALGITTLYWSSTANTADESWFRCLLFGENNIERGSENIVNGFSVRCVKD